MTKTIDKRELRKLNAALGLGGPGDHLPAMLKVVAVLAVFTGLFALLYLRGGPITEVYGVVTALGFTESDMGSRPYAAARVDGRPVRVRLHPGSVCRVGDRIAIRRHKMIIGYRHGIARAGCTRRA